MPNLIWDSQHTYIDPVTEIYQRGRKKEPVAFSAIAARLKLTPATQGQIRHQQYLGSPEWKEKRRKIIMQRQGRCEKCHTEGNLEIHHKTYARIGRELDKDLLVLCTRCHIKEHQREAQSA